jgi:hypothetical protein
MSFDIQETTVSFDHTNKKLHIYTSRRSVFLGFIKRNPNYAHAEYKCGGYFLVYPGESFRSPVMVLRSEPGGEVKLQEWLSPQEQQAREAASERLGVRRVEASELAAG